MRLPLILAILLLGSLIGPIDANKNQKSKTSPKKKSGPKKRPAGGGNPAVKGPTRGPTLGGSSSPSLQAYPSWMAKLDGGLSITQLSIPGTVARCVQSDGSVSIMQVGRVP